MYWISTILESNDAQVFARTAYIYNKQLVLIGLIFFKNLHQRLDTAIEKVAKDYTNFTSIYQGAAFQPSRKKGKLFGDLTSTLRA
jgi:TRAP-type C4-dicarboxylate transport system substrate-binding protein